MTSRPFRRPTTPRRKAAPAAPAPVPAPAAAPDPAAASALAARVRARCKTVALVTAPSGESLDPILVEGRHGRMSLEPVLDGRRLHELSARSPTTAGGGYVVIELAPVHGPACAALSTLDLAPCDCGAQALFESLVLSGA